LSVRRRQKLWASSVPYEKSAAASSALIVAFVLLLGTLAEPESGLIHDQRTAWLALAGLPFAIAAIFCVEYKVRNRRQTSRKPPIGK
jgi:hypothetical protein